MGLNWRAWSRTVWGAAVIEAEKPILFWSPGGYYNPWVRDVVSFLRAKGAKAYDFVTPEDAVETLRALRAVAGLRKSLILYIGEPSGLTGKYECAGVIGSCWDFEVIRRTLGPTVKLISTHHLLQLADSISEREAKSILESWRNDFEVLQEDWRIYRARKRLIEVAKLYRAMEMLITEHDANALTINCLGYLFKWRFVTPCVALGKLLDKGIIAGCEGDLNTLLTMMLFSFATNEIPLMGNLYLFRPSSTPDFPPPEVILADTRESLKSGKARLTHDVLPRKLCSSRYRPTDYHGTGKGITAYAELRKGVITLGRLDPRLDRLVFTVARIEEVKDTVHCRFSIQLSLRDIHGFVKNISSHHVAMIYGDWGSTLRRSVEMLGLEVIWV